MRRVKSLVAVLVLGLAGVGVAVTAEAGTYTFSQVGFEDGGRVDGYFTGDDNNHDGKISYDELTDMWLTASGGQISAGAGMGWGVPGSWFPNSLTYTIGSHVLTDIYAANRYFFYTPGSMTGLSELEWGYVTVTSSEPIWVVEPTPAPEPARWAMMLAGLGLAGVLARRRQACGQDHPG